MGRGGEVDAVGFAHCPDLLPGAGEADEGGVEFGEVGFDDGGGVAVGVAGDEDRGQDFAALGFDNVDHLGHLVELVGADVRAVGEAEIYLLGEGEGGCQLLHLLLLAMVRLRYGSSADYGLLRKSEVLYLPG